MNAVPLNANLKSRMWESCSYGSGRVQAGNCLFLLDIFDISSPLSAVFVK